MLAWNILFVPARRLFGPLSLPLASTAVGRAVVVFAGLAIVASEAGHRPWRHVIDPPPIDNLHPVLETLAKRWRPGENVVVHFRAWAAFGLYSRLLDLPDLDARRFGEWPAAPAAGRSGDDAGGSTTSLAELPVEGRTWYVAVWKSREEKQEQRAHRARLAQGGEQLDAFTDVGAGAWLFDLGPPINRSAEFR